MNWKKIISNLFFRQPQEEPYPSDQYCTVCEGRLWPWTNTVRIASLGMNKAHLRCAADYLREELEYIHRAR